YYTAEIPTLDQYANTSVNVKVRAVGVYSRLLQREPGAGARGKLIPDVAASWEVADGGQTYMVKLNPKAKFHPPLGRPVTADDVIFSYKRFIGQEGGTKASPNAGLVKDLDSVTAPDQQTLVFK